MSLPQPIFLPCWLRNNEDDEDDDDDDDDDDNDNDDDGDTNCTNIDCTYSTNKFSNKQHRALSSVLLVVSATGTERLDAPTLVGMVIQ